jgi:putative ABC transport system permease protein
VERAQAPWAAMTRSEPAMENAIFVPYLFTNYGLFYVVRTQPGQQRAVMREVEKTLYDIDRTREIARLQPFSATREQAYRFERNVSVILATVCGLLLMVTALGIVGLTTYWVAQRRRQIGVRRALGARRLDILRYFHTENLLIGAAGAVLGIALGAGANLWLAANLQITRMSIGFILAGGAIVLLLGQLAVMWPALRAASIPPALAARGA